MIQANELRIGNLVWDNIAESNDKIDWVGIKIASLEDDVYEPISLTPEILEKCGFELVDQWYEGKQYMCKPLLIQSDVIGSVFHCQLDDFDIHLLSVHQLQNLYYALTNTELTINL